MLFGHKIEIKNCAHTLPLSTPHFNNILVCQVDCVRQHSCVNMCTLLLCAASVCFVQNTHTPTIWCTITTYRGMWSQPMDGAVGGTLARPHSNKQATNIESMSSAGDNPQATGVRCLRLHIGMCVSAVVFAAQTTTRKDHIFCTTLQHPHARWLRRNANANKIQRNAAQTFVRT